MIHLTRESKILLCLQPVDFRRGIDGFVFLCQKQLGKNPQDGSFFVFRNKRCTMIRLLVYEKNGFWLMTKRLSKGKFDYWPRSAKEISIFRAKELRALLLNEKDNRERP